MSEKKNAPVVQAQTKENRSDEIANYEQILKALNECNKKSYRFDDEVLEKDAKYLVVLNLPYNAFRSVMVEFWKDSKYPSILELEIALNRVSHGAGAIVDKLMSDLQSKGPDASLAHINSMSKACNLVLKHFGGWRPMYQEMRKNFFKTRSRAVIVLDRDLGEYLMKTSKSHDVGTVENNGIIISDSVKKTQNEPLNIRWKMIKEECDKKK